MKKFIIFISIIALGFVLINCKKKKEVDEPSQNEDPIVNPVNYFYKLIYLDSINTGNVLMNNRDSLKVGLINSKLYSVSLLQCQDFKVRLKAGFSVNLVNPIYNGYSSDSIVPTEFFAYATGSVMFMNVDGISMTSMQSKYKLMVHECLDTANQVNMGTRLLPVQWSGAIVHKGTVDTRGDSYFEISGFAPNATYWITLYSMTGDADLVVYSDNSYSLPYVPSIMHTDVTSAPEQYKFNTNSSGKLFIMVRSGELNIYGSSFRVLISPVN